jgi:hypothetical protein
MPIWEHYECDIEGCGLEEGCTRDTSDGVYCKNHRVEINLRRAIESYCGKSQRLSRKILRLFKKEAEIVNLVKSFQKIPRHKAIINVEPRFIVGEPDNIGDGTSPSFVLFSGKANFSDSSPSYSEVTYCGGFDTLSNAKEAGEKYSGETSWWLVVDLNNDRIVAGDVAGDGLGMARLF